MPKKKPKIKVFISGSCEPCQAVKELIEQGKFNQEDIDLIDLETPAGFKYIKKMDLNRVPSAYKGKEACNLNIDRENNILVISCPGDEPLEA